MAMIPLLRSSLQNNWKKLCMSSQELNKKNNNLEQVKNILTHLSCPGSLRVSIS